MRAVTPHRVYEASLAGEQAMGRCQGALHVQVIVAQGENVVASSSELRPIRVPPSLLSDQQYNDPQYRAPLDLGLSFTETVIMGMDWSLFLARVFALQWALLVGVLLLLPRFAGHAIVVTHAACHHFCFGPPDHSQTMEAGQRVVSPRAGEGHMSGFGGGARGDGGSGGGLTSSASGDEWASGVLNSPTHAHDLGMQAGRSPPHVAAGSMTMGVGAGVSGGITGVTGAWGPCQQGACTLSVRRAARVAVFPVAWTSQHVVARPLVRRAHMLTCMALAFHWQRIRVMACQVRMGILAELCLDLRVDDMHSVCAAT